MQRIQPGATNVVDVGSYKLELTVYGKPRRAHNPTVVIIPGIASSIKEWAAVTKCLSESISVVNYERAGFGLSDLAPDSDARTAADLAAELHNLLRAAKIAPPYILVSHSYGSIIAREFVQLRRVSEFKGFVFVDADTVETAFTYQNQFVQALQQGIDTLQLCYQDTHSLGDEGWQALMEEETRPGHKIAADREASQLYASGKALFTNESSTGGDGWGNVPLVVLQAENAVDLQKIYDEGVRLGNGTSDEREKVRELIAQANATEESSQSLLKLSTRSSFRQVARIGHNIHISAPESVVGGVIWILQQYRC